MFGYIFISTDQYRTLTPAIMLFKGANTIDLILHTVSGRRLAVFRSMPLSYPVLPGYQDLHRIEGLRPRIRCKIRLIINGIEKEGLKDFDEKLKLYIPHNAWQTVLP